MQNTIWNWLTAISLVAGIGLAVLAIVQFHKLGNCEMKVEFLEEKIGLLKAIEDKTRKVCGMQEKLASGCRRIFVQMLNRLGLKGKHGSVAMMAVKAFSMSEWSKDGTD